MSKTRSRFIALPIVVIALLLFSHTLAGNENRRISAERFYFDFSINSFFSFHSGYKSMYANPVIVPEFGVGYFLGRKWFVFGGFEYFSVKGETPKWGFAAQMKQSILSLGSGYKKELAEKLALSGELGFVMIHYNESVAAIDMKNKSSCFGFRVSTKLHYRISNLVGLLLRLGYTAAKDSTNDKSSDFGGLKTGIGIKLSF